jgi:hypothetical protein
MKRIVHLIYALESAELLFSENWGNIHLPHVNFGFVEYSISVGRHDVCACSFRIKKCIRYGWKFGNKSKNRPFLQFAGRFQWTLHESRPWLCTDYHTTRRPVNGVAEQMDRHDAGHASVRRSGALFLIRIPMIVHVVPGRMPGFIIGDHASIVALNFRQWDGAWYPRMRMFKPIVEKNTKILPPWAKLAGNSAWPHTSRRSLTKFSLPDLPIILFISCDHQCQVWRSMRTWLLV